MKTATIVSLLVHRGISLAVWEELVGLLVGGLHSEWFQGGRNWGMRSIRGSLIVFSLALVFSVAVVFGKALSLGINWWLESS
jgi:hypothetical protein